MGNEDELKDELLNLKLKAVHDRIDGVESRVVVIEKDKLQIKGWLVKVIAGVALYIFKDPIIRIWETFK